MSVFTEYNLCIMQMDKIVRPSSLELLRGLVGGELGDEVFTYMVSLSDLYALCTAETLGKPLKLLNISVD